MCAVCCSCRQVCFVVYSSDIDQLKFENLHCHNCFDMVNGVKGMRMIHAVADCPN